MRWATRIARGLLACGFVSLAAGCGGNGSSSTTTSQGSGYSIGGSVTGLSGSLVMQNNGGDNLTVNANGVFTFATREPNGAAYKVSVLTAPTRQTCTVANGAGSVSGSNVTSVSVVCSANAYKVSGAITGLNGTVVLQNNGTDNLARSANGAFVFASPVAQGGSFSVSVQANPAGQSCSVANGSGVMGTADITSVAITCTTNAYTVGGNLTGLSSGTVVLQNNGGDSLSVGANGGFTFPSAVAYGNPYNVTVSSEPANLSCPVSHSSGTVSTNVTDVSVSCSCASGYNLCSGACVNTSSDASNCGGCGVVCAANQACSSGSCVAAPCSTNANCTGGDVCLGGTCQAPTCSDGVKDGNETATDCGGGTCSTCSAGSSCLVPSDCQSGVCTSGTCQAATCTDGVKNGSETGVDCGGGACGACSAGNACLVSTDCLSGVCSGGICH